MWFQSFYQGKGGGHKLQPKYMGSYTITRVWPYQTCKVERNERKTMQNEGRRMECHDMPVYAQRRVPPEPRPQPPPPVAPLTRAPGPIPGEPDIHARTSPKTSGLPYLYDSWTPSFDRLQTHPQRCESNQELQSPFVAMPRCSSCLRLPPTDWVNSPPIK